MAAAFLLGGALTPAVAGQPPAAPLRIVSLAPAITETLFALGLGARVVAVSTYCDFPPEAASRPHVGSFLAPAAEAIVAQHPDLVLTSPTPGNESAVRAMQRAGLRVEVVEGDGSLDDSRSAMLQVARLAGDEEAGRRLVASLDARLAAVRTAASSLPRVPVAVVLGRDPLVLAGPASVLGELVVLAGGRNVADAAGGRWPRVGAEFLMTAAPEVLVDLALPMGETPSPKDAAEAAATAASSWKELASLPAVKNGRVVTDSSSSMLRPGPRLPDAAEALFRALHPGAALPPMPGPAR